MTRHREDPLRWANKCSSYPVDLAGYPVFGIISIVMLEFTYTCTMLRYMCINIIEDLWGTDCHHCTCVVMRDCIVLSITPGSTPPHPGISIVCVCMCALFEYCTLLLVYTRSKSLRFR